MFGLFKKPSPDQPHILDGAALEKLPGLVFHNAIMFQVNHVANDRNMFAVSFHDGRQRATMFVSREDLTTIVASINLMLGKSA